MATYSIGDLGRREILKMSAVLAGFKAERFAAYLASHNLPWPRLASGTLDLSDQAFREMARSHPVISPLRELRNSLSALRLTDLTVRADGRNRTILSAFRARSSRNAPSNSKFIFGPSTWLRGLIKPPPGTGVCYRDYASQEFGIAAALSGDERMIEAYRSGDVYLTFAKQAGLAPQTATKASHQAVRDQMLGRAVRRSGDLHARRHDEAVGFPADEQIPQTCRRQFCGQG